MRGSIIKQKSGSWRITVSLGKNPKTGKYEKYQETFQGSKRDADKRLAELIVLLEKGHTINPEKITVGEFLDKWLNDYGKSNLSERTLYDYTYIVNTHIKLELGHIVLQKLQPIHLRDFYSKLLREGRKDNKKTVGRGLSAAYVRKIHVVIHEALKHAVKWELTHRNAADAVDPPKAEREEAVPLTEQDVARLAEVLRNTYLYVPACIAVSTGLRLGEVLGLKWSDVDLKKGVITVREAQKLRREGYGKGSIRYSIDYGKPKGKKGSGVIDIPATLAALLKRHRRQQKAERLSCGKLYQDNDLVCCCPDGSPINNSTFSSRFSSIAKKAGLMATFHTLRHTHASLLLAAGVNLKVVQERLRHANISTTGDIYAHLYPDAQKEAASKIDDVLVGKLT